MVRKVFYALQCDGCPCSISSWSLASPKSSPTPAVSSALKVLARSRISFSSGCWHLAMTHKRSCTPVGHICRRLPLRGKKQQRREEGWVTAYQNQSRGRSEGEGVRENKEAHVCIHALTQVLVSPVV